jgi:hypothetical protein
MMSAMRARQKRRESEREKQDQAAHELDGSVMDAPTRPGVPCGCFCFRERRLPCRPCQLQSGRE